MMLHILYRLPFAVMTALALVLFATTLMYWSFRPDINFLLTKPLLVHQPVWRTAFYIHIAGGMLSLVLGPLQFIPSLRRRFLNTHRLCGKLYVAAILFIGAPTGLYMAFYANGGAPASVGFALMSVLWFYTTWMGLSTIRQGRVQPHRQWMIRSYAVTFSAVTLRLWVPMLSLFFTNDHQLVVVATAWISWLFNLVAAECIIYFNLKPSITYENNLA